MPESRRRRRGGQVIPRGARSGGSLSESRPRRKKTNKLYLAASAIVAILVIAGFAVGGIPLGGGSQGVDVGRYSEYQEGIGVQQDLMPTVNHVPENQTVDYSTTPPTSGDHWDLWARCGFYENGLPDERIVHNLEHGNIVVSYNLPDPADVEQLREFMDGFDMAPAWAVTRSYDRISEGAVALSAWGVLDTMQGVDEERIERFFEAYAGKLGPEFPNGAPCMVTGVMS